jgi:ribosomal protein S18 acetylase RimI-like enzyme
MQGTEETLIVRDFRPGDLPACRKLYSEGLIGGKLAENDTALDIGDIESVYMKMPGSHFWVATAGDEVVGMIGVQHHDAGVGEIRRLRVSSIHRRRGIGSMLVEQALRFCQDQQYLKITLDTFLEREPAVRLFEKFGFRHDHSRTYAGRELMYFYLDLYKSGERQTGRAS